MFKFAIKNMAIKKVQVILVVLSIVISAGVGVLAFNTAEQVSDGITGNAAYYSAIIGPSGSQTQLAMNTMYFTDSPLGTIPYSVVSQLQADSRVNEVVPFAMADSYNGHSVVGSSSAFLSTKEIADGRMFDDTATMEVVVGAAVARLNRLKVGDEIHTSHSVGDEHHQALTVVGILKDSGTVYDNVVFTQLRTIWEVHDHEDEDDDEHEGEGEIHDGDSESSEEHDEHEHASDQTVCAILVKTKNPGYAMQLVNEYDGKVITTQDLDTYTLQAIEPMDTVRGVLEETNNTKYIVFVLCGIILIMNIMIISIITLLNMYHSAKEISLMRLIGISMKKVNLLYIIQNSMIGLVSVLMAFGVSRLCMLFMKDYVASMGVVLSASKVYPLEIVILVGVFAISVLPTVICTFMMSGKDGISD